MSARGRTGGPDGRAAALAGPGTRLRAGWVAATGTAAAASIALGLLVGVCTFIAVAVPRASLGYRTTALQRTLSSLPLLQKAVLGDADVSSVQGSLSPAALEPARAQLGSSLAASGVPLAASAQQWSGLLFGPLQNELSGQMTLPGHIGSARIQLLYRSSLAAWARLVAGRYPSGARPLPGDMVLSEVAVTQATAQSLRLRVGSRVKSGSEVLVVTGIVAPVEPASLFWGAQPSASSPQVVYPSRDSPPYLAVAAFVGEGAVASVAGHVGSAPVHALWGIPLDLRSVSADQAPGLARALGRISYLPVLGGLAAQLSLLTGPDAQVVINLSAGLADPLSSFAASDDAVQAALSLLLVSLAVVAVVVVLLGARLLAEHRRAELTLMRARGASLARLAGVTLAGSALAVLPAALAAAAAGVAATPGPGFGLPWWLAGSTVAAALAGPPLMVVQAHRLRRRAAARALLPASRRRRAAVARRWVAFGALVCASVAGLVMLRLQGTAGPGTSNLFTSAAPALTAVPIAVLIMTCLPAAVTGLLRLARRRRGVVAVLGLARGTAASSGPSGVLPVFALILALAVIAFAAMDRNAVSRGNDVASWRQLGADALVTAPATGPGITPGAQRALASVPGVRRAAALSVTTGASGQGPLTVVIVDPASYAAVVAGTPALQFPATALASRAPPRAAPGSVPVLVSPAGQAELSSGGQLVVGLREVRTRYEGSITSLPGAPTGGAFAVLPRWALGSAAPSATVMALSGPHLDASALAAAARRVVPGGQVTLRSQVLAAISGAPLSHGGFVTFAQGAAAAAGMMLLILLLTLVLTARSRELTMARLVTMGLASGQWRRIVLVETLPSVIAAIVGGTVCALVLVPLVGPAINVAAFSGLAVTVPLHADPVALAAAATGLLVLVLLTTAVQNGLARRRGEGRILRVGD
jgi:putative ABC transport system permease protein